MTSRTIPLVNVDTYLDETYGPQTHKCSLVNLVRGMDFVSYIVSMLDFPAMCGLFETSNGIQWCELKWDNWLASNRSVWWLWTALDKRGKETLCNWYLSSGFILSE